MVERELSDEDFFKQLDEMKSAQTKRNIKTSWKTADELFDIAMQKATGDKV